MREAVRNAVKHRMLAHRGGPRGTRRGVHGLVEDDGEGFDPEAVEEATPSWGVGLGSMRERLEMLGGSLRVDSEPGAGTKVEVRFRSTGGDLRAACSRAVQVVSAASTRVVQRRRTSENAVRAKFGEHPFHKLHE